MKTLLLGMGNPILSDDAIGVRLAKDLKAALQAGGAVPWGSSADFPVCRIAGFPTCEAPPSQEHFSRSHGLPTGKSALRQAGKPALRSTLDVIEECSVGGLNLLDLLRGYERVIVLDSLQTSDATPGAWHRFTAEALRETVHLTNIHDANFATALGLGRRLGLPLPEDREIHIFAVEIEDNRTFSERMTPALERAYPTVRAAVFKALHALLLGAPLVSRGANHRRLDASLGRGRPGTRPPLRAATGANTGRRTTRNCCSAP
ncbi:MAG: hypothetical protein HZA90_10840 [Verrucomicrobia bacterium]|nr:hypothetical protein [Verrucomicrobiota bacterium]